MRTIVHCVRRLLEWLQIPRNWVYCLLHGLRFDPTWRFYGLPHIRIGGRKSQIRIGHHFTANSSWKRNSFGIIQPVMIRTVGHGAKVVIGNNVGVSGCTISAVQSITIGNDVMIGSGVVIVDQDAHPVDPDDRRAGNVDCKRAPVVIEDDVFIGARAIVLKGVTIGRGSVVGAGAVVTKSIPPYSIAVGNPARVIGDSRKAK